MPDDPPETSVVFFYMPRQGVDRHLPRQRQNDLLKQQSEGPVFLARRKVTQMNAASQTVHSRNSYREVAVILEEIQMSSCYFLEFMRLAQFTAFVTRVQGATFCTNFQIQSVLND